MGRGDIKGKSTLRQQIEKYKHVGGAKPFELQKAELILGICDRFHKLPSEVVEEDLEILRFMHYISLETSTKNEQ